MEEEKEEGRELREREREALCPILGVLGTPHKSSSSVGASLPPNLPCQPDRVELGFRFFFEPRHIAEVLA